MNWKSKLSIVLVAVFLVTIGFQSAQAQSVLANLTDAQTLYIILTGLVGGLLLAYQNERTHPTGLGYLGFVDTALRSVIVTIPIALASALTQTDLNLFGYVIVFFASIGATVQLQQVRQATIP